MPDIGFEPTFNNPTPWVDSRDRVQAGGDNGFNARFTAIANDLVTLGDVVGNINSSLNTLGQQPAAVQKRLTLAPALLPVGGVLSWSQDVDGFARRPSTPSKVAGLMPVTVPVGAKLLTLRVVGQKAGDSTTRVQVDLMRSRLAGGAPQPAERVVRVGVDAASFDRAEPIQPAMAVVDENFRYFLLATVDAAVATEEVALAGFQIVYQESR
jgi:hypothetical protein